MTTDTVQSPKTESELRAEAASKLLGFHVEPGVYDRIRRFTMLAKRVAAISIVSEGIADTGLGLQLAMEMTTASMALCEAAAAHAADMSRIEDAGRAQTIAIQAKAAGNGNV